MSKDVFSQLVPIYKNIFEHKGDEFQFEKVKRIGMHTFPPFGKTHKFLVIVSVPSIVESFVPDSNGLTEVKNQAMVLLKDCPRPNIVHTVKLILKKKDGTKKKKIFDFMVELSPSTVVDFYVEGGRCFVMCEGYGKWS